MSAEGFQTQSMVLGMMQHNLWHNIKVWEECDLARQGVVQEMCPLHEAPPRAC